MRAEQQILVAETGGDVEHRQSGRQPFVQEARAAQGELPGDQGRAQGLGVACLLGDGHGLRADAPALVLPGRLPVRPGSACARNGRLRRGCRAG